MRYILHGHSCAPILYAVRRNYIFAPISSELFSGCALRTFRRVAIKVLEGNLGYSKVNPVALGH